MDQRRQEPRSQGALPYPLYFKRKPHLKKRKRILAAIRGCGEYIDDFARAVLLTIQQITGRWRRAQLKQHCRLGFQSPPQANANFHDLLKWPICRRVIVWGE